jgi:hypothetical protein
MGWKFWKREPNPMDPRERPQDRPLMPYRPLEGVVRDQLLSGDVISR